MAKSLFCDAGAGGRAGLELKVLEALRKKKKNGELAEADAPLLERLAKAEESNKAKLRNTNDSKADGGARHANPTLAPPAAPAHTLARHARRGHPPTRTAGPAPAPSPRAYHALL